MFVVVVVVGCMFAMTSANVGQVICVVVDEFESGFSIVVVTERGRELDRQCKKPNPPQPTSLSKKAHACPRPVHTLSGCYTIRSF